MENFVKDQESNMWCRNNGRQQNRSHKRYVEITENNGSNGLGERSEMVRLCDVMSRDFESFQKLWVLHNYHIRCMIAQETYISDETVLCQFSFYICVSSFLANITKIGQNASVVFRHTQRTFVFRNFR